MRPFSMTVRAITLFTLACFVTSCLSLYPEQFAGPPQVYPDQDLKVGPSAGAPPDAIKKGSFDAPFEDVWRAVNAGTAQAQLNIESSQKKSGIILATKLKSGQGPPNLNFPNMRSKYTYAIFVKEVSAKVTDVNMEAKVQSHCVKRSFGSYLVMVLTVIGILFIPFGIAEDSKCEHEVGVPHWATGQESSEEEMTQTMALIRNNLIAAGAL